MPIELKPGDKVAQYPGDSITYRVWEPAATAFRPWLPPAPQMPVLEIRSDVITVTGGHHGAAYKIGTPGLTCTLHIVDVPLVVMSDMLHDDEGRRIGTKETTAGEAPAFGEVVIYRHGQAIRYGRDGKPIPPKRVR